MLTDIRQRKCEHAAGSTGPDTQTNVTAAAGAVCRRKQPKAEQPGECGGEQAGQWMFWRRMEMQELRDRLLSQMPVAAMTESEIEAELAALKLSEPGWQVEARRWRLTWEQKFRKANGGGSNE
jgi:hypothetical protein